MQKIAILGCGYVGSAIAYDLSREYDIIAYDIDESKTQKLNEKFNINTKQMNVLNLEMLTEELSQIEFVISAVTGNIGYEVLKSLIMLKKNVVDISFFPESPIELNELAEKNQVKVVFDAGVAPGLSNMVMGYHNAYMKVENFHCYVGGLPFERKLPFQYKAPFSPKDVLEEYIRPARFRYRGTDITKPALTDLELLHFDAVGTLEAFNTDGCRSLLTTYPNVGTITEKTLRYPGHADLIKTLIDIGFLDNRVLDINNHKISPFDMTSSLLENKWKLDENENEFTVMRIIVDGESNGNYVKFQYDLFDISDMETRISSMSRTTGFTCTAVALLMLNNKITDYGVFAPEEIAENSENFKFILDHLEERGIILEVEQIINNL